MDYRPDLQPSLRDILTYTENVVPDKEGSYFTSYTAETSGYTVVAASGSVLGARQLKTAAGTARLVVGTGLALKEANGSGGWTDRSGTTYGLGASHRWWFNTFAGDVIACSEGAPTQKSSGAAFSDLTAAPRARLILSQSGHLLACNHGDGSSTVPDGVRWCTQGDSGTWTATGANSAGSAILRESPGPIVAGAEIHDIVALWKARSMYVGRRIGGREVWQFNLLSPEIGCLGLEAHVKCPVGIIFASEVGIYRFDGSVPVPIDHGVRRRFYTVLRTQPRENVFMSHDDSLGCVFLWVITNTIKYCFAYNYVSEKWSIAYTTASGSINIGSTVFTGFSTPVRDANFIDAKALGVDEPASGNRTAHLIFAESLKLTNLSSISPGNTFTSKLGTGHLRAKDAAPDQLSYLDRICPLWATSAPVEAQSAGTVREPTTATATVTPYSRLSGAGAMATVASTLSAEKMFDVQSCANVHTVTYSWTDEYVGVADFAYKMRPQGRK